MEKDPAAEGPDEPAAPESGEQEEQEVPFFYTNLMEAHLSAFDFTITFGYRGPKKQPPEPMDPVCVVAMSHSHAKSMLPVLARLIAQYEQRFGAIPAPGYDEKARE